MPYSTVVAGTTITAAWSNTNNRDQVITPFASAAARDSAITSPVEGMHAYLTDTDKLMAYNGAAWVPAASNIVARQALTVNSSVFSISTTTDFVLNNVVVRAERLYAVHVHSEWAVSAGAVWDIDLRVDGVIVDTMRTINTAGAVLAETMDSTVLLEPTSGTKTLDIRATFVSGGTFQFAGSATAIRRFWIEDIGPR